MNRSFFTSKQRPGSQGQNQKQQHEAPPNDFVPRGRKGREWVDKVKKDRDEAEQQRLWNIQNLVSTKRASKFKAVLRQLAQFGGDPVASLRQNNCPDLQMDRFVQYYQDERRKILGGQGSLEEDNIEPKAEDELSPEEQRAQTREIVLTSMPFLNPEQVEIEVDRTIARIANLRAEHERAAAQLIEEEREAAKQRQLEAQKEPLRMFFRRRSLSGSGSRAYAPGAARTAKASRRGGRAGAGSCPRAKVGEARRRTAILRTSQHADIKR